MQRKLRLASCTIIRSFIVFWVLVLAGSSCSSLFYFPSHYKYFDPAKSGHQPEDIWFKGEDQAPLHGWYFKQNKLSKAKASFLFFHGNGENLSSHFMALLWILEEGYDFFIFDYRGYGETPGKPTPENTVQDGHAALRWLHQKDPSIPLVVFGQSLGGAVSLRTVIDLKDEIPVRLVVVDSTFSSYRAIAQKVLTRQSMSWPLQPIVPFLVSDHYAPGSQIESLSPIPLVVIHGDEDTAVDFSLGQRVYELAKDPKEFWRVPGGTHIDAFWRHHGLFRKKLLEKLKTLGM